MISKNYPDLSPQYFLAASLGDSFQNELRQRKARKIRLSVASKNCGVKRPQKQQQSPLQQPRPSYNAPSPRSRGKWVIPLEHPFKVCWDIITVILSFAHGYMTHVAIRDRQFGASPFFAFCSTWFLVDFFLNFFTERKTSSGEVISDHRGIVARYLTSWFAVDALSLFPWERLYMQPLIELQNRRGILQKSFFRSRAVVRVTRHLRGKHFRWFGTVTKHTKQHGIGAQRLLRLIIKYVPKYFMFLRNMKGVVAVRFLRFVHWVRRFILNTSSSIANPNDSSVKVGTPKTQKSDASTKSMSTREEDEMFFGDDDDSLLSNEGRNSNKRAVELVYDLDDDDDYDDGVPL
jgi:hypothetical protein